MYNINPIAWSALGASWCGTLAQITTVGLERDAKLSLAASIVAAGAVVLPALLKAYRGFRDAQRTEDLSDHRAHVDQLAAEVTRRAEAEARVAELERQLEDLKQAAQTP